MPITVLCDFPSGKTIIGDAKEIEVKQCDTELCFEHEFETNFPQSQITSLMDVSMACSQELTYSCISATWKVLQSFNIILKGFYSTSILSKTGSTGNFFLK